MRGGSYCRCKMPGSCRVKGRGGHIRRSQPWIFSVGERREKRGLPCMIYSAPSRRRSKRPLDARTRTKVLSHQCQGRLQLLSPSHSKPEASACRADTDASESEKCRSSSDESL
jgi:hypothetical protein